MKKALILAGGLGTRLKEVVSDRPKPMALIAGKPFLEHQIRYLKTQGIEEVILAVHYGADKIKSYFRDGKRININITYSDEDTPLGTAGAIKNAERYIDDTFLVLNGDSYSKLDLEKFLNFHKYEKSSASLSLKRCENFSNYGNVIIKDNKVIDFSEKKESLDGFINTGIYIFEPNIFDFIPPGKKVSLEEEIFPLLVKKGNLYGHIQEGYFIDIGRPETYKQFKKDILESMCMKKEDNLRAAMQKINNNGIDLVLITDYSGKLLGVVNNSIINEHILKGYNLEDKLKNAMISDPITAKDSDDEVRISEFFSSDINRLPIVDENGKVCDVRFRVEETRKEALPILRGKSPLRVSFGGGGTDLPYFFEKYGGVIISSTIDKYCHATAIKRADSKIILSSDGEAETIIDYKKIKYDGNFDLVKAIIKIMNPDFGFELYLHNDLPFGKGLGSSASLSVLVSKLISGLEGSKQNDGELAEIAFRAETEELGIRGGWQDQYAAATGGFNFMEFSKENRIIYPLRLKEDVIHEFNSHLIFCSVGESHFSGDLHKSQEETFYKNEKKIVERLNSIKENAIEIKNCLLDGDIYKIGRLFNESWENKKKLSDKVSNQSIDALYKIGLENGAQGGRLLGSGGGGYLLFYYSPKKRKQLKEALERGGGEIMDFNFESQGVQTWIAK